VFFSHCYDAAYEYIGDINCWNCPGKCGSFGIFVHNKCKNIQYTKTSFTIGLMFLAGMLMLRNIIAVYFYFVMESLYSMELMPFFVVIHLAELTGIAS
jgi:uncharacterized membrane protein YesL